MFILKFLFVKFEIINNKEVKANMARCPYLDYESNSYFGNSNDKYICKVTGVHMDIDDTKVKYVCKAEYGDEYKKCAIYQDT